MKEINLRLTECGNSWQVVRQDTGIYILGPTKHNVQVQVARVTCNWNGFDIVPLVDSKLLKRPMPIYLRNRIKNFWEHGLDNKFDMYEDGADNFLRDDLPFMLDSVLDAELPHLKFLLVVDGGRYGLHQQLKSMALKCDLINQANAAKPIIREIGVMDWLDSWMVAFINSLKYPHYVDPVPDLTPHMLDLAQ